MTSGGDELVEPLKTEPRLFFPVSKIPRRAGTDITEIWNVHRL
jgi:hypothetical protein